MLELKLTGDFAEATRKQAIARLLPRAFFRNAESWADQTIIHIKRSYKGGRTFKRPPKDLDLRLGAKVTPALDEYGKHLPDQAVILLGTGRHIGRDEVVYAAIQEHGGPIRPKGHPFLTIPLPGVKGSASQYPRAFLATTAGGQWLLAEPKGKTGIRPLFLLRRFVELPARRWFSRPIEERKPALEKMMSKAGVLATATRLAQGGK